MKGDLYPEVYSFPYGKPEDIMSKSFPLCEKI